MIEFKRKYSIKNGNKVTRKNWHKVVAISDRACTNVHGVQEIERIKAENGVYFQKWKLVFEKADPRLDNDFAGYIFREVNHNGGISGKSKTYREAIWSALPFARIFIEDGEEINPNKKT